MARGGKHVLALLRGQHLTPHDRAYSGHQTTTMAMTALSRLGPSTAAMAIASTIDGKARTTSTTRMTLRRACRQ